MSDICPSCGAAISDGGACRDSFDLLLVWEWEYQLPDEHHLLVCCYHLQHPHLYSREGLAGAIELLRRWVIEGEYVFEVRESIRSKVSQGKRDYPITARPDNIGAYPKPVTWTMTAADVVAGQPEQFYANIRAWAQSVVQSLQAIGVMPEK